MTKNLFLLLLAAAAFGAESCKTYTSYDELRHLSKGMSSRDAEKEFDLEPTAEYKISHEGATYLAKRYPMQIGVTTTTTSSGGSFNAATGMYTPGISTTSKSANTVGYLLLFRDDRLLYWGFLQEFAKSEDPLMLSLSGGMRDLYYKKDD